MANGTVRRVHVFTGYRRRGLDRDVLYGFLWLTLRLVLRGDRAGECDKGSKYHNQFLLHGHRIFSFPTKASPLKL
jgi:hypothetical protein